MVAYDHSHVSMMDLGFQIHIFLHPSIFPAMKRKEQQPTEANGEEESADASTLALMASPKDKRPEAAKPKANAKVKAAAKKKDVNQQKKKGKNATAKKGDQSGSKAQGSQKKVTPFSRNQLATWQYRRLL